MKCKHIITRGPNQGEHCNNETVDPFTPLCDKHIKCMKRTFRLETKRVYNIWVKGPYDFSLRFVAIKQDAVKLSNSLSVCYEEFKIELLDENCVTLLMLPLSK